MAVATMTVTTALRAYADWLDANPAADQDALLSYDLGDDGDVIGFRVIDARGWTRADMATLSTRIGGWWTKSSDEHYFKLTRQILPGIRYELFTSRNAVCERVVVGTETVEVPDPDAPKITIERDVVEWRCPDSILAAGESV